MRMPWAVLCYSVTVLPWLPKGDLPTCNFFLFCPCIYIYLISRNTGATATHRRPRNRQL